MPEPRVRITIVDDSTSQTCAANCGTDWSSPEALRTARQDILSRFGDEAKLEYVDLPKATDNEDLRRIKSQVSGLPLPVLLTNGRPRIAGEFDGRQLMDVIEADLEEMEA